MIYSADCVVIQQQHSSKVQLGHWKGEMLELHSFGVQLQSAHFTLYLGVFSYKV